MLDPRGYQTKQGNLLAWIRSIYRPERTLRKRDFCMVARKETSRRATDSVGHYWIVLYTGCSKLSSEDARCLNWVFVNPQTTEFVLNCLNLMHLCAIFFAIDWKENCIDSPWVMHVLFLRHPCLLQRSLFIFSPLLHLPVSWCLAIGDCHTLHSCLTVRPTFIWLPFFPPIS